MVEKWVVGTLISRDFGGSWNPVRRLLETDNIMNISDIIYNLT